MLGSEGARGRVEVLLDGEPIPTPLAGEDVEAAPRRSTNQRLYRLVDLDEAGDHTLELRFEPGRRGLRVHVRLGGRARPLSSRL